MPAPAKRTCREARTRRHRWLAHGVVCTTIRGCRDAQPAARESSNAS